MAYWLPYHRDGYFSRLNAAVWGGYKPEFTPDPDAPAPTPTPETVRAAALKEYAAFDRRADRALTHYRAKKGR